jgi:hypothetical protein
MVAAGQIASRNGGSQHGEEFRICPCRPARQRHFTRRDEEGL